MREALRGLFFVSMCERVLFLKLTRAKEPLFRDNKGMGYLIDYVKWKGDVPLGEYPFNVFDSMVISALSYIRLDGLVAFDERVPLKEAIARVRAKQEPVFATCDYPMQKKAYKDLLNAILASKRFGRLLVTRYADITEDEDSVQFSASTYLFPDGAVAIGFRGTDETIVGWKEDAQLSFQKVSAQAKAAQYAKEFASTGSPFYLCGHSKGGNLALYAALSLSDEEKRQLNHLYLLDSPGLCPEVFGHVDLSALDPKTTCITPGYDVVGQFFPMGFSHTRVVAADAVGILQHAFLSWKIEWGDFLYLPSLSPECDWVNKMVRDWLIDVPLESRLSFMNGIFNALTAHGEKTIWDLGKNPTRTMDRLLVAYTGAPKKEKGTLTKLGIAAFFGASFRELIHIKNFPSFFTTNLVQSLALIVIGVLLIVVPSTLPWIVVSVVSALLLLLWVIAIYYLVKSKGDWKKYRLRLTIVIVSSLAYAGLGVLGYDEIVNLATWASGMLFIFLGLVILTGLVQNKEKLLYVKIIDIIEIVLYCAMGCFMLFAPSVALEYGIFATGIIMVADGVYKFIR